MAQSMPLPITANKLPLAPLGPKSESASWWDWERQEVIAKVFAGRVEW